MMMATIQTRTISRPDRALSLLAIAFLVSCGHERDNSRRSTSQDTAQAPTVQGTSRDAMSSQTSQEWRAEDDAAWTEAEKRWAAMGDKVSDDERRMMSGRFLAFTVKGAPPDEEDLKTIATPAIGWETMISKWKQSNFYRLHVARILDGTLKVLPKRDPSNESLLGGMMILPMATAPQAYQIVYKSDCPIADTVTFSAQDVWFLDAGETGVTICKNSLEPDPPDPQYWVTHFLTRQYPGYDPKPPAAYGYTHDHCGPYLLGCYASSFAQRDGVLLPLLDVEVKRRGLYYFDQGASFNEWLFGRKAYVNRYLAWQRLVMDGALYEGRLDPAKALAFLKSIPRDSFVEVDWPEEVTSNVGVLHSTAFMHYYASGPRARARGVVTQLLCGMDWNAMPTGSAELANPYLTKEFAAPAKQTPCAETCHLHMDNMASLFSGYIYGGRSAYSLKNDSRLGEFFGVKGKDLHVIGNTLSQQPRFYACMAENYFRRLSGLGWRTLDAGEKKSLLDAAAQGPKQLIDSVTNIVAKQAH